MDIQIRDMHVVADAGSIRRGVIGTKHFKVGPLT